VSGTHLVPHSLNGFHDVWAQVRLLPEPNGVWNAATLARDVIVFTEDTPVSLCHLLLGLVSPVTVIPLLFRLLLGHVLQSLPGRGTSRNSNSNNSENVFLSASTLCER